MIYLEGKKFMPYDIKVIYILWEEAISVVHDVCIVPICALRGKV